MTGRAVGVVQARLGSSRLPAKVLADFGGRSVIAAVVEAARRADRLDEVVLAVPTGDDALIEAGAQLGCTVATGDEDDVLARFAHAARLGRADTVVRLTGDCPLLDAARIDAAVAEHAHLGLDYLSLEGLPRGTADVEVIGRGALDAADAEATDPWHREHVGTFFPDHPDRFAVLLWRPDVHLARPEYRVCVDEGVDLAVAREVRRRLAGDEASVERIVAILDADPELARANAHVVQVTRPG